MQPNVFLGVLYHAFGAFAAASCYTPQKKTRLWSWEVYWIAQATFAWLILPIIGAVITIPDYFGVLAATDPSVMLRSFLLGMLYGIGGLTFGLGIRYIGFSLNYTIAIGLSAVLGTLAPLVWNPNDGFVWLLREKFSTTAGMIVLAGIVLSLVGIMFCGWAGALRERSSGSSSRFSFKIGVPLAVLAGVLSAVFAYALEAGKPLEVAALEAGASDLLKMNAIYPFSHGGAWVTNVLWCLVLVRRNRTGAEFFRLPQRDGGGSLSFYYLMALVSGAFWYFQFFFYGMGNSKLGPAYEFTSWALHMAMLILFSNLYGWLFSEWVGASKTPKRVLHLGMAIIVAAVLVMAYGNYLGKDQGTTAANTETPAAAPAIAE